MATLIAQQVACQKGTQEPGQVHEQPDVLTVVAIVDNPLDAGQVEAAVMAQVNETRAWLTRDQVAFVGPALTVATS